MLTVIVATELLLWLLLLLNIFCIDTTGVEEGVSGANCVTCLRWWPVKMVAALEALLLGDVSAAILRKCLVVAASTMESEERRAAFCLADMDCEWPDKDGVSNPNEC